LFGVPLIVDDVAANVLHVLLLRRWTEQR